MQRARRSDGAILVWLFVVACAPAVGAGDHGPGPEQDPGAGQEGEGEVDDPGPGDPLPNLPDPGPADDPAECSALSVEAAPAAAPADIIWVIDNSGSMDEEEARVQDNLNTFSQAIENSGVDHHVVMITNTGHVQVPPPLGGSEHYLAVDRDIDSHDALQQLIATFPEWRDFLRPDSIKHFVVVSDDESDMSEGEFENAVAAIPELAGGFVFHAIVADAPPWNWNSPCFTLAAAVGTTYIHLQQDHGGVFYSLCEHDWAPVFDALSVSVIGNATLPCAYSIPAPPEDTELDWDAVNFVFTPDGAAEGNAVPYVGDEGACAGGPGWYYDSRDAPTEIRVCPATCTTLEDSSGQVDVAFGCATLLE